MSEKNERKYMRIPAEPSEAVLKFSKQNRLGERIDIYALTLNMSFNGKAVIMVSPEEIHEGEVFAWQENETVESLWKVIFAKQIDIGVWRVGMQILN